MGCGQSQAAHGSKKRNPPLSATKMNKIAEMDPRKHAICVQTFEALDKDGSGSITLEDSIWAKPFLDAHDIDGDGQVTVNEYLYACAEQLGENADWTPIVQMLSMDSKAKTSGKYLVLGPKGAGKTTMITQLKLGGIQKIDGVDKLVYKQMVRPVHTR